MPVKDVPLASLDSESDLMDWLITELTVTTYNFVEKRVTGDVAGNDIEAYLELPAANTFHGDSPMLLYLARPTSGDGTAGVGANTGFNFNLGHIAYDTAAIVNASASLTVDFDLAGDTITITAGDFADWATGGYNDTGLVLVVTDAADPLNNGVYYLLSLTSGSTVYNVLSTSPSHVGADATGDVITVQGEHKLQTDIDGFFNGEQGETAPWNAGMWGLDGTGPYVGAKLITSPTSASATPSEPLYFYLIVEISTGVYTQFAIGELVKLNDFSGGMFFSGNPVTRYTEPDIEADSQYWLQGFSSPNVREESRTGQAPGGVWSDDWTTAGLTDAEGRGWLSFGSGGTMPGAADGSHYHASIFPHYRGNGRELIGFSPSPFSGQSERWPLVVFGAFGSDVNYNTTLEHAPMGVFPDVFLADITNVDAGSVFIDDYGEIFYVVPFHTKTGSGDGSTEKWGYLIRNPALT